MKGDIMAQRKSIPYAERKFDKTKAWKHNNEYQKEVFDRITFVAPKGYKEHIKTIADSKGISSAELIRNAIDDYIDK